MLKVQYLFQSAALPMDTIKISCIWGISFYLNFERINSFISQKSESDTLIDNSIQKYQHW